MEALRPRGDAVAACRRTYHDYTQRVATAAPLNVRSMERNFNYRASNSAARHGGTRPTAVANRYPRPRLFIEAYPRSRWSRRLACSTSMPPAKRNSCFSICSSILELHDWICVEGRREPAFDQVIWRRRQRRRGRPRSRYFRFGTK